MVNLFFLRGLCGYAWANILTLSPLRVGREEGFIKKSKLQIGEGGGGSCVEGIKLEGGRKSERQ